MNTTIAHNVKWPRKHDLFGGVKVTATNYEQAVSTIIDAARAGQSAAIDLMPVHVLVTAVRDPAYRRIINAMDMTAPDGQPVRWSLNYFHKAGLTDRVYGPELMRRLCSAAASAGVPIYLYGSSPEVIEKLSANLKTMFPTLVIAGAESPPFRPLTPEEDRAAVQRINDSGAKILFVGTGCPRQEIFAVEHRDVIRAVQVCVGAAFDFHAGAKKMAPSWMQKRGLEWLFRLTQEPGRLWQRYLVTNSTFIYLFVRYALEAAFSRPRAGGNEPMADQSLAAVAKT